MKTKYIAVLLSVLLFASVFAFGGPIHRASAQATTLSISSFSATPGETSFTVPVQITDVNDLFGFDINITYDNTLINFSSLDSSSLSTVWPQGYFEPLPTAPSPQTGPGYVRFAALAEGYPSYNTTGTTTLFQLTFTIVKADNFPHSCSLHLDGVKLSDPNANPITFTPSDGTYSISAYTPGIYFSLFNPNSNKPYEYGKYFEVQVYATNIFSSLNGYDLKVDYSAEFMTFVQVQPGKTYVLGSPTVTSTTGVAELSVSSGGPFTGNNGLLFTLTFQIAYDIRYSHIWRSNSTNQLTASISLDTTSGSLTFGSEGALLINSGLVSTPSALTITITLIKGDVDCNGVVNVLDLRDVANYYDQSTVGNSTAALYDIKIDSNNIIDIYDLVEVASNFGYNIPDTLPADP
jgi:hypothetical protein